MENINHIKNWEISIKDERKFWDKYLLNKFVELPENYKYWKIVVVKLGNNNSIVNLYLGKCNYYKCIREQVLRKGAMLEYQNKTHDSVLY